MRTLIGTLGVAAALMVAGAATAQVPGNLEGAHARTLVGRVVDATTGAPLAGVLVTLENAERTLLTDSTGRFSFKGVRDEDGPVSARLIGYASVGQALRAGSTPEPLTLALRADPVLLRGLEVVAHQLRRPSLMEAVYSVRRFGTADLAGVHRYWTARDFLRAHGYAGTPLNRLAPGPRRISASQIALTDPRVSGFGYDVDRYWAALRNDPPPAAVVVDNRTLALGLQGLDAIRAYEVYTIDVYDHGRGVVVYTKAWVIDHAAEAVGLPPFELPLERRPYERTPFDPNPFELPPG